MLETKGWLGVSVDRHFCGKEGGEPKRKTNKDNRREREKRRGKKRKRGKQKRTRKRETRKEIIHRKKNPGIQGGTTYDPHDPNLSHVKHFITIYPVQFVPFLLFPNERTIASSALSGDLLHTVGGIFALGGERGFPDKVSR